MAAAASYATVVQQLYVAYFGRPADVTGLQNFEAALASADAPTTLAGLSAEYSVNPAITALINAFGNSTESGNLYGTNIAAHPADAQEFVTSVFASLFNRAPVSQGLDFWSNAIITGSVTPGDAALQIALGAATADAATLANKVVAATTFTADLEQTSGGAQAYSGAAAAAAARAYLTDVNSSTVVANYSANATEVVNALVTGSLTPTPTPTPTPAPTPTPTPAPSTTMALTVSGDSIHLSGSTAASTVSLSGADLTAFPLSTHGTVAELLTAGITGVTDSGGGFILNASGNANATTFNFGTGVVSGADAASSAGITYQGVTTYVTTAVGDTVTLSAAGQNVTGNGNTGNNTVNLGSLAYAGTLDFGSGGTDTVNVTVGSNISAGNIESSGATVNLVLSGAGTETISTAEANHIHSITGGSAAGNTIVFTGSGGAGDYAGVQNYHLDASNSETMYLSDATDIITGGAAASDTVEFLVSSFTGSVAFGASGADTIKTGESNGNIGNATAITTGGATVGFEFGGSGETETMTVAQYALFTVGGTAGGISGGSDNAITFTDAGTITANNDVGTYNFVAGSNTVNVAALTYAGTLNFGATGANTIEASGGDISGATITHGGGSTVAFQFSGSGPTYGETMSTEQYNYFSGISGGTAANNTITFSDSGVAVTDIAAVGNYVLSSAGGATITLTQAGSNVTDNGSAGGDVVNLGSLAYTGTLTFGSSGIDTVNVTVGHDISGGDIESNGATVNLVLSAAGTETMSTEEFSAFSNVSGGSYAGNTIVFSDANYDITTVPGVGNYTLAAAGGSTIYLIDSADSVTDSGSVGGDFIQIGSPDVTGTFTGDFTGSITLGGGSRDVLNMMIDGDISSATITSSGAPVAFYVATGATETISMAELTVFEAGGANGGIDFESGPGTLIIVPDASSALTLTDADFANFQQVQTLTIDSTGTNDQSITLGTNFGSSVSTLTTSSTTGTITIDASADTHPVTINASSTGAGGSITITTATVGDTVNATVSGGSTLTVTSNSSGDSINLISNGGNTINVTSTSGVVNITSNGVDTIDLGAAHTSGSDTLTLYQTAEGTTVTNWMSADTLNLSLLHFTGANAIYGDVGSAGAIGAESVNTANIVAFAPGAAVVGDVYSMGATTEASAAALQTYLRANTMTFSGSVPAAGASLLFEYEDNSGNAHIALVQVTSGATDTSAATVVNIAEFVGVPLSTVATIHFTA